MLAGKRQLTGCYRSTIVGAQLRFTPSASSLHAPAVLLREIHDAPSNLRPRVRTFDDDRGSTCRCGGRFVSVAPLSTTNQPFFPAKRERKHLQPRERPVFRQRSQEEKALFVGALRAAQEKYRKQELVGAENTGASRGSRAEDGRNRHSRKYPGSPSLTRRARSQASITELEHELQYISQYQPHPIAIYNILKILIHDRKVKPGPRHYEALILANCWPEFGSVQNLEKTLEEMEAEGIEIDVGVIVAVLKVLAIHPSPNLSHAMLEVVERRWIQLPSQAHHHLILAMVRTGQTELASWVLDVLRTQFITKKNAEGEVVPDYLVVLLVVELVRIGDWEGVLRYVYKLRNRRAADREIPNEFWGWVLERTSKVARHVSEQCRPEAEVTGAVHATAQAGTSANPRRIVGEPTSASVVAVSPQIVAVSTSPSSEPTDPDIDLDLQLSLDNPAAHLTEYIWTMYVEPMSIRPSHTTCLNVLHIAANTGKAWLANSTLAVLTYVDGVTADGKPKSRVGDDVKALVSTARERELAKQDPQLVEKEETAAEEAQTRQREDEEWWAALFKTFEDEGEDKNSNDGQSNPAALTAGDAKYLAGNRIKEYEVNRDIYAPSGNLWPLFPRIDGVGSAQVDAWTALGEKSSARRRWTDAQRHYRQLDKRDRNSKNKGTP